MKENIYFKITNIYIEQKNYNLKIKNIFNENIKFKIEDNEYILKPQEMKLINFSSLYIQVILLFDEEIIFSFNFNKATPSGYGKDSYIETLNGPLLLKDISDNVLILDKDGNELEIEHIFICKIDKKNINQPVIIDKSNCGMNLPYSPLIMSINNCIKIRKIILKGRQLFLNGKAKLYKFDDYLEYYHIKTKNSKEFLINGFISDSIY